jgi:hypothetical protein
MQTFNIVSLEDYKKKSKKNHHESDMQIKVASWIKTNYPDCLFTIAPNDIKMKIYQAKILKQRGYRKGTSDFLIFEPRGIYHGFFLELKTAEGKVSEEQKNFLMQANDRGYMISVARCYDEAIYKIHNYLIGKVNFSDKYYV